MEYDERYDGMDVQFDDNDQQNETVPNADVISLETVVNMLVQKNVCTAEELFILEGRIQELNNDLKKSSFVSIQKEYDRGRLAGLKRLMSKRRWTRRLGTALFGWKWKKVKKSPSL